MDVTSLLKALGIFGIGATTIAAAVVYLAKKIFERWLDRDVEKFKIKLQANHETEIERLKADLQTTAFEHETRFARLHERRADVIAELYKRLVKAENTFSSRFRSMQWVGEASPEEKDKDAREALNALVDYFFDNRLYFSEQFCQNVEEHMKKLHEAYSKSLFMPVGEDVASGLQRGQRWDEIQKIVFEEAPYIKKQVEQQMREILGIQ